MGQLDEQRDAEYSSHQSRGTPVVRITPVPQPQLISVCRQSYDFRDRSVIHYAKTGLTDRIETFPFSGGQAEPGIAAQKLVYCLARQA